MVGGAWVWCRTVPLSQARNLPEEDSLGQRMAGGMNSVLPQLCLRYLWGIWVEVTSKE